MTLDATDHEPVEGITIHTFPVEQVMQMARAGAIHDAISILALLLAFG